MHADLPSELMSDPVDIRPLASAIDVDALSGHLTEVILDEVYSHVVDPETLRDGLHAATHEKISCLARLIGGTVRLDDLATPAALSFAAEVGGQGIPERTFERSYRIGQETLWDWWMNVVQTYCHENAAPVVGVVRSSTPVLFGFVDRMLFASLAAYHDAASDRRQTVQQRRSRLVEQILDGTLMDPGIDAERFLGYTLRGRHLAGVVNGADAAVDRELVARLQELSGASELLTVARAPATTEFWLNLRAPLTPATRKALTSAVRADGQRLAFGYTDPGVDGFRRTSQAAGEAAQIQVMLGDDAPRVTWSDEVRIEILALHDPAGARTLIRHELGPLLDDGLLTARMQSTLEAWLMTGSYVGAAARLGVHEQTVRQRLRRLEGALGHPLNERRTELHVALRLSRVVLPPT